MTRDSDWTQLAAGIASGLLASPGADYSAEKVAGLADELMRERDRRNERDADTRPEYEPPTVTPIGARHAVDEDRNPGMTAEVSQ